MRYFIALAVLFACSDSARCQEPAWLSTGTFEWTSSPPLLSAQKSGDDPDVAFKDPSVVYHDGRWHLFGTHRAASGKVAMQYLCFEDWDQAQSVPRHPLRFMETYHCAPQVFYYTPHQKWYLIYQAAGAWQRGAATLPEHFHLAPVYSTTSDISDPDSWTSPQPMISETLPDGKRPKWIDFWVICDEDHAHLFYTSDDGHFWRRQTTKANFPLGWSDVELVLKDSREELFEASLTYKLKDRQQYLTIIEAIGKGHRYYKAWLAEDLAGPWQPLATTQAKPFASAGINVSQPLPAWTTSISHGELIRSKNDETLEIDPHSLQFLYQGVSDEGYRNRYAQIPWSIGLLKTTPMP